MTGETTQTGKPLIPAKLLILHLFALCAFAVGQPLYDLLAQNVPFFVAHNSSPTEILLFVLTFSLGLPLVLLFLDWLSQNFGQVPHSLVRGGVICILVTLTALGPLKKMGMVSGGFALLAAGLTGLVVAVAYFRFPALRSFLSLLSPAALLFPLWFLLGTPMTKLVFGKDVSPGLMLGSSGVERPPIVFLIFDELPILSLLNETGEIDAERLPNFAALAKDSTFYRNASTVAESTHYSIPAMVTGKYPVPAKAPVLSDYPENLFTLFAGNYDLKVFETSTGLSPAVGEETTTERSLLEQLKSLLSDSSVVYLHIVVPPPWDQALPSIGQTWGGFAAEQASTQKKLQETLDAFLASIQDQEEAQLFFFHSPVPHYPWIYLPSGKRHLERNPADLLAAGDYWPTDESAVAAAYQRHLLQVGYADRILGQIVEKLKSTGLYDRSLLLVVSDHGITFRPGAMRRRVGDDFADVMAVPLFLKRPGQEKEEVSMRNVQTIDLLPILAEEVSIRIPWKIDGIPLSQPENSQKLIFSNDATVPRVTGRRLQSSFRTEVYWNGKRFLVGREMRGHLGPVQADGDQVFMWGWGAHERLRKVPEQFLVFVDGKLVTKAVPKLERPGVVTVLKDEAYRFSGFQASVPADLLSENSSIRVFSVLGDEASELLYPDSFEWNPKANNANPEIPGVSEGDFSKLETDASTGYAVEVEYQLQETITEGFPTEPSPVVRLGLAANAESLFFAKAFLPLLGRKPAEVGLLQSGNVRARLEDLRLYKNVRLDSDFVPATIRGSLPSANGPAPAVAVAVNGVLRAVARAFRIESEEVRFCLSIPESALKEGANSIDLYVVRESNASLKLEPAPLVTD